MKKLIIAAFLLVGISTYAQEKKENPKRANMEKMTPQERQDRQLKRMTSELTLNAKQQEQIKELLVEQGAKREKLTGKKEGTKEEIKAQREALKNKMQDDRKMMEYEIKDILTTEQFSTWKTNQEKMTEKAERRMKERMDEKIK